MNTDTSKASPKHPPTLDNDYYLKNFHTLVSYVMSLYSDLLNTDEKQWYNSICSAQTRSQRLYIRLLGRKGSLFRVSRLHYDDIDNTDLACAELVELKLASCEPPESLQALLSAFTKPELLNLLQLNEYRRLSRPDLIAHIEANEADIPRVMHCLQEQDQWLTMHAHTHWMLMQLCFFGNLYQDSSEFVVSELGHLTYANYAIEPWARAFTSRDQIDAHWRYFECAAVYATINKQCVEQLCKFSDMIPQPIANDANLLRRTERLKISVARQLERINEYDKALALFETCSRAPARERRIRILIKNDRLHDAYHLAQCLLDEPLNESERLVGERLVNQCKAKLELPFVKLTQFRPISSELVLKRQARSVEELARRHYASEGACFYTENTLVNGVLGLFIWDIMFHPVPGAFFNPFQIAPADFYHPEFYQTRESLLKTRFKELDNPTSFRQCVLSAFEKHKGQLNPLVRWQGLSVELLNVSLARIPVAHWRAMFTRILLNLRENSKGFPDLVLFTDSGEYEFIEIKGPGDVLQAHQRQWMKYFSQHEIACRVVHVKYQSPDAQTSLSELDV